MAANVNAVLDNTLGGYVPASVIATMKTFNASRVANVLSQIPGGTTGVTATTTLAVTNGYPRATTATTNALSGTADGINARSVLVNGLAATFTAATGAWTAPTITLNPGINHVLVQARDANNNEVGRTFLDIWYDKGTTTNVSGTLAGAKQAALLGLPLLLVYLQRRLGYDRRAFAIWIGIAWSVMLVCYFWTARPGTALANPKRCRAYLKTTKITCQPPLRNRLAVLCFRPRTVLPLNR